MKRVFIALALLCFVATISYSQSIVIIAGNVDFLKEQKVLQFTFSYNEMLVGKKTESEHVSQKIVEYNKKKVDRGDEWGRIWVSDRKERFEPKFLELFDKYIGEKGITSGSEGANYIVEVNTDFTEPGWNVGVMRQNASVDLSCKVKNIKTGEKVASIRIRNASANNFLDADFTSGYRIQETYAKAGREFAKFFIKKGKLSSVN